MRPLLLAGLLLHFSFFISCASDHGVVGSASERAVADFSELARKEQGRALPSRQEKPWKPKLRSLAGSPPVDPSLVVPGPATRAVFGSTETDSASETVADGGALFTPASVPPSPAPSASFPAVLDNGTQFNPDTQGAVGTNHMMVATQQGIQILNRFGVVLMQSSQSNFWSGLGATNIYDPRLLYDPYAHRWIHVALADPGPNRSGLLVAVSQTSDPTASWNRYYIAVDATAAIFPDSPNVGFARDVITIQANMYDKTNFFQYSFDFWVFNKGSLYAGVLSPPFTRFSRTPFGPEGLGSAINAPVPAATYDPTVVTNYLVGNWNGNTTNGGYLRLYYIATNECSMQLEFNPATFSFEFPFGGSPQWEGFAAGTTNFAPQLGTANKINVGDARIQNCVFRNASLWAAQTIYLPATSTPARTAVQWWELTPPSGSGCPPSFSGGTVIQRGRIDDSSGSRFYAYPSIAVSRGNDVLIGYSRFAADQYPSANYAFRVDADVFSTLRGDTVLKPGEAKFFVSDLGFNHWGDWSATVVDPNNDTELWTLQEYASSPVTNDDRWGTWWGRVSPPSDLSVTMTGSTNSLIAGSNITYSITVMTTNNRVQTVGGVRLVNTLPAGSVLVSSNVSQGTCLLTNGVVTCNFGNVGTTGQVTATLVVRLNNSGTINNTVTVSAHGPELTPGNNSATVTTTVSPSADLAAQVSGGPDPVTVSNRLTYTITVTNRGPTTAGSVQLSNTLPPNVTFISHTPSQGSCSRSGNLVTCSLGNIALNSAATVQIVVAPNGPGMQTNRVSVLSAAFEPVPSDNTSVTLTLANASPTMGFISDRQIDEDMVLSNISFLVGDFETPATSLVLTGFCSNPALVPNANILFGGNDANRTITVIPAPNASGIATITRIVTDALGATATNSFQLTVNPINDMPTINDTPNFTILEDTSTNIVVMVSDIETPASVLGISAASSNPTLVPNGNLVFVPGGGSARTLTITPATNQSGTATISLTVSDGTNSAVDTFVLTVQEVNDPPTISVITNRSVLEDTSTGPIAFTVFDIETQGSDLVVTASSTDLALTPTNNLSFTVAGTNRTVTILPGTNQFGVANVTLTVRDSNGATASTMFQFTVIPVNDPPGINPISPVTTNEDAGPVSVALTGISSGAPNEFQGVFVTASSSNPSFIPSPGVAYNSGSSTGLLTFASMPNSNGLATITVTVMDDGSSNNVTVRTFDVNITAVNDPPTISDIPNRTIIEDSTTGPISFTVGDVESLATSLSLFGSSSDTNIVPNSGISFSGTGANRAVTVAPAANAFGVCTITVLVSDGQATNSDSFVLTVTPVNDLPSISSVADRTINEDSMTNVTVTVGDLETAAGNLIVVATSSNQGLVPNSNLQVTNNGATRIVAITPATNQSGTTTIMITVTDADNGSTNTSFLLTVASVNDPPTLAFIPDVTVNEDAPQQSVLLTGISGGPANEPQTVTFSAVSSAPSVVPNPAVGYTNGSPTGVLRFTPAPNASGDATITVTVDDGATSNRTFVRMFVIHVLAQNDLPILSSIASPQMMFEDSNLVVNFTVSDVETAANNLLVNAFSTDQEIIPDAGLLLGGTGNNRTLSIRAATNTVGSATILIEVTDGDGGTTNTEFEVMIFPVNDAPGVAGLTNLTINENTGTGAMPFTVDDPDSDISSVTLTVASSNPALVPPGNLILGGALHNRTLAVTPATNQFGTATITVTASDGFATSTNSFVLTVLFLNTLPTISDIGNRTIFEDGTTGPINVTVGDAETAAGALVLSAASTDTVLVPTNNILFAGSGANRTVTVTPAANRSGVATITISVSDGNGGVTNDTFVLTVNAVNDPPTLNLIPNLTTNEDPGPITIQLSGISAGPNENQPLTFQVTSSNPSLIPTPQLNYTSGSSTALLTCTPVPNATGSTVITLTLNDGAPANNLLTRMFTITITPVNDVPTISSIPNQPMLEDSVLTVPFTIGDAETPALSLTLSATSTNPAVLPTTSIFFSGAGANRTVTFVPLPNQFGTSFVSVAVSDGIASSSTSFIVSVISVNDRPTLDPLTNVNVAVSPGTMSVPLTGISPGAANETEALSVTVTNNAPGTFWSTLPTIGYTGGSTGLLTFRPANNASGSYILGVIVNDIRGSNNLMVRTFTLNVRPNANTAPTISFIPNQTVAEDTVIGPINFTVGDTETPVSSLIVTALSTNETLLPNSNITLGGSGASRTITLTPAPNRSGVTLISVTVQDSSSGAVNMNFIVTVSSSNDMPTISAIGNQSTLANTPTPPILFDVRDVETPPGNLTVTAASGNTALVPNGNIVLGGSGTNRALYIIPAAGQSGSALITVTVNDGLASANSPFILTVTPPPTLRIELMTGKVLLSWPSASGPNWTLLGNTNMTFSADWTTVPSTPVLVSGRYWITNLLTTPATYFRLRSQ
jgi:uncharacterized repeat protein (TIGR01451 family)